jgi:hypothetical protein
MPPLNVIPLGHNFLTDQPLRLRTSDGEVSWDQPGPLFDPAQTVASLDTDGNGVPDLLRTRIGALVASEDAVLDQADLDRLANLTSPDAAGGLPLCPTCGYLIVSNPTGNPAIPPDGTVVAIPAFDAVAGVLQEVVTDPVTGEPVIDPATGLPAVEPVVALEAPINEIDFLRPAADVTGVPASLASHVGRLGAEVLGKALFWDMQVGSDGVQSCGSCHFHAGTDNRTKNQLNPNHLGGNLTLQVRGANEELVASDFPFHKLVNPDIAGEPLFNPGNVASDADDVVSSMGVRFRQFTDIPAPGPTAFAPATAGVSPLLPDVGAEVGDPIPAFQGLRRVEPRNTPTMHSTAFNFDNFWDGRARFHFNGGSVFGPSDPQFHVFIDPADPVTGVNAGVLSGTTNGHIRPDLLVENPEVAAQPVRIKFSSLASLATGPALSDFEMSFAGRNWAKLGKKLLQAGVTPLANQLVAIDDSRLGPFSNQGGSACASLAAEDRSGDGTTALGKPGLCISYPGLVRLAFDRGYWANVTQHLDGAPAICQPGALNGTVTPVGCDPFDGYVLGAPVAGVANPANTNQFTQMEANFSMFFGLGVQIYVQLLIPDDTPFDQFMDANPLAANGVAQPGEQGTLPPDTIRALVTGSATGNLTLVPGFGPEELFGFDVFAGANLTAALPVGSPRNPAGVGSNPFLRTARCMLCHIGPEQTDHSVNISHGLIKGGAEYELPIPPTSPEPTGPFATVGGLVLAEEIAETAQDVVELEPRDMGLVDDPSTPWDERVVSVPSGFAFGDQGVYNIGLRPVDEDVGRGGNDPFGWPLQMGSLAMKNIGGADFEPCVGPADAALHPTGCLMSNFNPALPAGGLFEESGGGAVFPGTTHTLQSINPGFDKTPINPQLPPYMSHWVSDLPAGELHPQIDELGFVPNTVTANAGGPAIEFGELLFGSDLHCAVWSGNLPAGTPGANPPRWGALNPDGSFRSDLCPNLQSSVAGNLEDTLHGTWPFPNRVGRAGAFKAPQLRNVELTGPYFHTGSYLTLRQVVDFYMRGGDFPVTNGDFRDQHIVDVELQVFGFGATTVAADPNYAQFAGGLPDTVTRYGSMPDTLQATPEYATQEEAKVALVKFLLSLTDARVKHERAPFDRPEMFLPLDGLAPDNTGGRAQLVTLAGAPCTATSIGNCFRHLPEVGSGGRFLADGVTPDPLPNYLGISSTPVAGPDNDHFDRQFVPPPVAPPPAGLVTPSPQSPGSSPVAAAARTGGGCSSTAGGSAAALLLLGSALLLRLRRRRES